MSEQRDSGHRVLFDQLHVQRERGDGRRRRLPSVAYTYAVPETFGGQFTQTCIVGVADGDHGTNERLIYGSNGTDVCGGSETTGCDTQDAHWGGTGSLWVR